jgi:FAD/FMN-containing dehydrogenase
MSQILNDVHSQLNPTEVAEVMRPCSLDELVQCVVHARRTRRSISVSGGRHAMGGQQFGSAALHVDCSALKRVLARDCERGLLAIEAGADWPAIIAATRGMVAKDGRRWAIRQKQTGVDNVSLAGSISANAHGRGLLMQPLVEDIEDITIVNARGEVVSCSRHRHAQLFSLVVGGYGLFGLIYSATLRLSPRRYVRRLVDVIDLEDAMSAVYRRVAEGCRYGDFQFVIDSEDERFLRRGVFACYKPVAAPPLAADDSADASAAPDLAPDAWLRLIQLAHEDKKRAFTLYAQHYLATDGNGYWADTMQLSTYIPGYADYLEKARPAAPGAGVKETLVIGEHYVPRDRLPHFMRRAREILKRFGTEVIYGTIRSIKRDTTSFLPWAGGDFACVIFNLRTPHTEGGRSRTAATFRALIDASIDQEGSFFLTYHRYATLEQVLACYPQFRRWLHLKLEHDPSELFSSDWYAHYRALAAVRRAA